MSKLNIHIENGKTNTKKPRVPQKFDFRIRTKNLCLKLQEGCDTLPFIDIRLRSIQQTTNTLITRPFSGGPNCKW